MICGAESCPLGGQSGLISGCFCTQFWSRAAVRGNCSSGVKYSDYTSSAIWPLFRMAASSVSSVAKQSEFSMQLY